MNHDWQILSCPWLAHVAWLHKLAGIHRGSENTSDLYHSGPTLDQTVVSEARPCDIVCLSVCLAVLKAATCLARATAVTPRLWPRRFRSTMTPSTPCTSPELVSTSTIHLQLLFLSFFPNPLPVSLLVVSLHSYLIFRICTRAALGWGGKKICCLLTSSRFFVLKEQPTSQPAFPLELPFKPAIQCCETSEVFPVHKKKTKIQVEPLFSLFSIWMSALLCL